jgi:hypothetical protein
MRPLFALLLLAAPVLAAPVPPPPRLTEAGLVGTYWQTWGHSYHGPVTFGDDGSYRFENEGGVAVYLGYWWLEGNVLVLMERTMYTQTGFSSPFATRFEIDLTGTADRVTGTVRGSNAAFTLTRGK